MSQFLRLLSETDKAHALAAVCTKLRAGQNDPRNFELPPSSFDAVPGKPFAYWTTQTIRDLFVKLLPFEHGDRLARQGLSTADDFRFARCWWEVEASSFRPAHTDSKLYSVDNARWYPLLKGGGRSAFVASFDLVLNYQLDGKEVKAWVSSLYGNTGWSKNIFNTEFYFRRGFSWALRSSRFAPSAVPDGCIFSASRYQAFTCKEDLPWTISLLNSSIVSYLLRMCAENFERPKYVVGIVAKIPFPDVPSEEKKALSKLFEDAAALKIGYLSFDELSHHFQIPGFLKKKSQVAIETQLAEIISQIDFIANKVFGISDSDIQIIQKADSNDNSFEFDSSEDEEQEVEIDAYSSDAVLSWSVGVAFGRFDLRLATGERQATPALDPFEPLPCISPGMLPDGAKPFHAHAGILVDDDGHKHDLARLIEGVLGRIDVSVPGDVRRWLQKDFFALHLQRYSKSRRKAPIYWPLSTVSGSFTLWLYYPKLSHQTLFTAVNDFLDGANGKLTHVSRECADLRSKGSSRSRDEEKQYEILQIFEQELIDMRDTLLKIAPAYQPNHDDGVQITAAPLWQLFRHKPWQKVLKDTWSKLEKGDYDWAHLAMVYWPERVREKCKTNKSLAIAHGLEDLYVVPEAVPKKIRGKKNSGANE